MKRFINPKRVEKNHDRITTFSDEHRASFSGVARGDFTGGKEWIGDMLFKNKGDSIINSNSAELVFYNDHDMTIQTYGNVLTPDGFKLSDKYSFFRDYMSGGNGVRYELETSQYNKIGQTGTSTDTLKLVDSGSLTINKKVDVNIYGTFEQRDAKPEGYGLAYYSSFWRYSMNKGDNNDFRTRYLLVPGEQLNVDNDVNMSSATYDGYFNNSFYDHYLYELNSGNGVSPDSHLLISKMYNKEDQSHVSNSFVEGISATADFEIGSGYNYSLPQMFYPVSKDGKEAHVHSSIILPEVLSEGVIHKSGIIAWSDDDVRRIDHFPGVNNKEESDFSKVSYSIPSSMLSTSEDSTVVRQYDDNNNLIVLGIDGYSEANRRHSAVVTTSPYMTVKPMHGNESIEYTFVDKDGKLSSDIAKTGQGFLKIKSSRGMSTELNNTLGNGIKNTDIIHTITLRDVDMTGFVNSGDTYSSFGRDMEGFIRRSQYNVFDIVGGPVFYDAGNRYNPEGLSGGGYDRYHREGYESGVYTYFTLNAPDSIKDHYTDGIMKVAGISIRPVKYKLSNVEHTKVDIVVYCCNFTPEAYTDSTTVVKAVPLYPGDLSGNIIDIAEGELFTPMIKMPAANGFIKILNMNTLFEQNVLSDGSIETVYNVEIPFSAGTLTSLNRHVEAKGGIAANIVVMDSYAPAGSNAIGDTGNSDSFNTRYIPYGDDCVGKAALFSNRRSSASNYVTVENTINGIGVSVKYPSCNVWAYDRIPYLSITSYNPNRKFNTIELDISRSVTTHSDSMLQMVIDSRSWMTGAGKHLPYIGRENPSYEFTIDVESIYRMENADWKNNQSLPSLKRWLYAHFEGGSSVISSTPIDGALDDSEDRITASPMTRYDNDKVPASLILEVYNNTDEVWEPFSLSSTDDSKVVSSTIVSNLNVMRETGQRVDTGDGYTILSVEMTRYTNDSLFVIPCKEWLEIRGGYSNVAIKDESNGGLVHNVIYMTGRTIGTDGCLLTPPSPSQGALQYVDAKVKIKNEYINSFISKNTNSDNEITEGSLTIFDTVDMVNDSTTNSTLSNFEIDSDGSYEVRYIDIDKDREKYAKGNNLRVRVRIVNGTEHPVNYSPGSGKRMQHIYHNGMIGNDIPWLNNGAYDTSFDHGKSGKSSSVGSISTTYFKLASV